ncbi:MAG TPA: hypothetical protein VN726_15290 [Hanamia sp.]|nr:hypothetical protein [Hanamia sp.]
MELTFDTSSDKQKQAAEAWLNPNITDIVYGGSKGGGKSYLGASLIFANALTYDGTRYFIARKQLIDLRNHTIPTIEKVFKGWGIKISDYGRFNGQDHCYYFNNGSSVLLIDAKDMPSDPLFERFGSMEMTQGWIEEAGEFAESAMTNLSISIGRCLNDKYGLVGKLLQTCNPKKNYLYRNYYIPWKTGTLPPDKVFIQAFAHENKKNEAGYVDRLKTLLKGIERERLLEGNWEYSSDASSLIEYDKILDIFTNTHVPHGKKYITADIARLGGDKIVIIEWDGWRGKVKHYTKQGLDITGAKLEELRYKLQIGNSEVLVDEDGMGGGIVDFLKFKGFVNNSSPLAAPNGPVDDNGNPIKENYDNLKSQCYFRMAERINRNELYLECDSDEVKQWIIEELEQVKQKALDSDLKKGVVPKDKVKELIGRSPDFSDAIMQREWFELKPKKVWAWA